MPVKELKKTAAPKNAEPPKHKFKPSRFTVFVIIFIAVLLVLNVTAVLSKRFSDFYLDYIFRAAAATTGRFSGLFPFSLGEVLITIAIILVIAALILSILLIFLRKHTSYKQFTLRYLCVMLVISLTVGLLYTLNCTILYCSSPMIYAGGTREFDVETFEEVRNLIVTQCNELAPTMKRSEDGTLIFDGSADDAAVSALHGISNEFPRLSGYYPSAKQMMGSYFMYKSQIIGVYFPFSMEANYSKYVSDSYLPHVLAHEYAHLKGYIYESEANFISFLACVNSSDDAVKYSGLLCVLYYLDSDYKNSVPEARYNEQVQISDLVKFDDNCYDRKTLQYLKKRDEEKQQPKAAEIAENVSEKMMDSYMDAFDYKPNYSEVTLLMMQYYVEYGSFIIKK